MMVMVIIVIIMNDGDGIPHHHRQHHGDAELDANCANPRIPPLLLAREKYCSGLSGKYA